MKVKYIFVYGVHKRNKPNNKQLKSPFQSKFLRNYIVRYFKLYAIGSKPVVIKSSNPKDITHGELYAVNEHHYQTLASEQISSGYVPLEIFDKSYGQITLFVFPKISQTAKLIPSGNY